MADVVYVNMANNLTATENVGVGVAATNNYVVIQVDWADLNGQPELVVETSVDDISYYPAKMIEGNGIDTPIKLRMSDTNGNESITIDSIYGATPYARVRVYGGNCTSGLIAYKIDIG